MAPATRTATIYTNTAARALLDVISERADMLARCADRNTSEPAPDDATIERLYALSESVADAVRALGLVTIGAGAR